jgi:hypothetical protein
MLALSVRSTKPRPCAALGVAAVALILFGIGCLALSNGE